MLFLTRVVSSSKVVNAPLGAVLKILHDPSALIDLNPIVAERHASADDPTLYHITDRFTTAGFIPVTTKYTAKFTIREDGVDTSVRAPAATKLTNRWRAKTVEGGGTEITEAVTVEALFLLMPTTLGMLRSSHADLLERLVAKLEQDVTHDSALVK